MTRPPPMPTLFPYTTLFRSGRHDRQEPAVRGHQGDPSQRCPEHFGLLLGCGQIETTVLVPGLLERRLVDQFEDRKSTRLNSSHVAISYAVFCLKKKIMPMQSSTRSLIKTDTSNK